MERESKITLMKPAWREHWEHIKKKEKKNMVNRIYTGISFLFLAAFLFAALFICAAIGGIGAETWGREQFLKYMFVYTPSGLLIGGIVALLAGISLFVWELKVYANRK